MERKPECSRCGNIKRAAISAEHHARNRGDLVPKKIEPMGNFNDRVRMEAGRIEPRAWVPLKPKPLPDFIESRMEAFRKLPSPYSERKS